MLPSPVVEANRASARHYVAGAPEPPDSALPWAAEEAESEPDVLQFTPHSRAA